MNRRQFLQSTGAALFLAACSRGGPQIEAWAGTDLFALCEIEGRPAVVAWESRDLSPRVAAVIETDGDSQVAWARISYAGDRAILGMTVDNQPIRFHSIDGSAGTYTDLGFSADIGDFVAVADTLYLLGPMVDDGARVEGREVGTGRRIFATVAGMAAPSLISAGSSGALALGNATDGAVVCVPVDPSGRVGPAVRVTAAGGAGDATQIGDRTYVTVQHLAQQQGGSPGEPALVEITGGEVTGVHPGFEQPRLIAPAGNGVLAVDDARGAARVIAFADPASGEVLRELELSSPAPVIGLRAASDGRVAVLQTDRITLAQVDGSTTDSELPGHVISSW